MKLIFVTSLLLILGINGSAQYLGLKGLTVQATTILYVENNEPQSVAVDQLYAISFTDKILTHAIYSKGSISDSQIYQIENDTNLISGENTIYKFVALSGISGNRFNYEIKIDKDGKLLSLKVIQPDGTNTIFKGSISTLKTYKQ